MLIIMNSDANEDQINSICSKVREAGFKDHQMPGSGKMAIGVTGDGDYDLTKSHLEILPGVFKIMRVTKSWKLASRQVKAEPTIVDVKGVKFGGKDIVMIAGPCAVETEDFTVTIAKMVRDRGAQMLRGGAFKPRTSPYSFQGLGERGLEILAKASEISGLPFVTEVVCEKDVDVVAQYSHMLQIGARNMQNFRLLERVASAGRPVLLKRGMCATLDETLLSAEYLLSNGCYDVVLCERGVRTFCDHARNTLDISIIPALRKVSHLPIIVDPSHSSGKRSMVIPHALAGIGAGCDGLIVDVHHRPEEALCDGPQALLPNEFSHMMRLCRGVSSALGRRIGTEHIMNDDLEQESDPLKIAMHM